MNGPHDMGGMHGFGPIDPDPEDREELFHAEWERRAFAVTLAAGFLGKWSIDEARFARETMDPDRYLGASYYEKWLDASERLLLQKGLITEEELATAKAAGKADPDSIRLLKGGTVDQTFLKGGPASMDIDAAPSFAVGDRVRARNINPEGHTRIPRYVRGHVGEIVLHHGGHVFADASARGERHGEHLYTVRFEATDLWGPDAFGGSVKIDLWEPYLEAL
ncbi:nitrile hydratase subunit beta [Minwuia sp.]|uniref:nitrile hydratase subunit beta n=1 Tax=Minwuia sp. TaxID=2493630 RepID=UPI003A8D40BA